jgi:hypothetical protein
MAGDVTQAAIINVRQSLKAFEVIDNVSMRTAPSRDVSESVLNEV